MNYENDIRIDETALDVEWLEQPRLMMRYANHAADTRQSLDLAKENLDIVRAEVDKSIRSDPDRFGIAKITEAAVTAAILTDDRYREANKKLLDAKYEMDIASAAVRAVEQRKDALENLVKLHGQQYFAGPRIPRDISKEVDRKMRQQDVNMAIKEKQRTRQTE